MKRTLVLFAAALLTAHAALTSPAESTVMPRPGPAIAHGQDWSIFIAPVPEIPRLALPDDEVLRILPPVVQVVRREAAVFLETVHPRSDASLFTFFLGLLVGTGLLLMGYNLIPVLHARFMRMRSLNLREDLFL